MLLANLLFRTEQLYGRRPSFVGVAREFTWSESLLRIRQLAGALAEKRASRVAILARNSTEYLELTFACPIAGVAFVPMNTRLAPPEMRELVGSAAPEIIFTDDEHLAAAEDAATACAVRPGIVRWGAGGDYEAFLDRPPIDPVPTPETADWAIIFTGGTTGMPKGVRVTRAGFAFNLLHILRDLDWGATPRFLQVTPLFHLAALGPSYAVAAWGGVQHLLPDFSTDGLLEAISAHRIEVTNLVPTMIGWLTSHKDLNRHDLSSLRALGYGASAIPESVLKRTVDRFPRLKFNQFYGQTEASGGLTTLGSRDHDPDSGASRLRSAGQAVHGVHLQIQDEKGREVERGAWGEICARTPGLFAGYLGHPEATARAMRDGWLLTGDVGYMDDEGYLYVTDRLKDMIVTGGENVSSSEVESALLRHPAVLQAAVISVPDEIWGERVHAFLRLTEGASADPSEIVAHCRTLIAGYKCPRSISFVREDLPLSAIGKIRKDILREQVRTASLKDAVDAR